MADPRREECLKFLSNTSLLGKMKTEDTLILLDTGNKIKQYWRKQKTYFKFHLEASKFRSSSPWLTSYVSHRQQTSAGDNYYNLNHLTTAHFPVFRINFKHKLNSINLNTDGLNVIIVKFFNFLILSKLFCLRH